LYTNVTRLGATLAGRVVERRQVAVEAATNASSGIAATDPCNMASPAVTVTVSPTPTRESAWVLGDCLALFKLPSRSQLRKRERAQNGDSLGDGLVSLGAMACCSRLDAATHGVELAFSSAEPPPVSRRSLLSPIDV